MIDKTELLFPVLDNRIVNKTENLRLTLGEVSKSESNPLFSEEYYADPPKRWEARFDNLYPNVIYDEKDELYKLWYSVIIRDPSSEKTPLDARDNTEYSSDVSRLHGLLYACSEDGISWTKPGLDIIDFDGSTKNNIVMSTRSHGVHGAGVLYDVEEEEPERRFKAFYKDEIVKRMAVGFSSDGLHWTNPVHWPEHNAAGDTHNNAVRLPGHGFVGITRTFVGSKEERVRAVLRTESDDFINWSEPTLVFQGTGPHDQIYSMPIFKYGSIFLGLPAIFHKGNRDAPDWDTVDTELAWSPDTLHWYRVCPGEPLIPRGVGRYPSGAYDCGCVYAAVPLPADDEMHIYYGGSNGLHNGFREGSFCLATLPRGRFAGYRAAASGRLETTPFKQNAGGIAINADVDGGSIRAGLTNGSGGWIDGFGPDDCSTIREGGLDIELQWRKDIRSLNGHSAKLVFELEGATLYSIAGDLSFEER